MQATRADVFELIFLVFLGLGTIVGIVVVSYIMYNAYKYRDAEHIEDPTPEKRPVLGELPVGGQGGRKLFLSFIVSAIIVVSLIIWTYSWLLYVEEGPDQLDDENAVEIDVEASAFTFLYNYDYLDTEYTTAQNLVVPADRPVQVNVTSNDVWHTFGIPRERVKADALPGEYDVTWFEPSEPGYYENAVQCFELCGPGHSAMGSNLVVVEASLYDAAVEAEAVGDLASAIEDGDLAADASPDEFENLIAEQQSEDGTDGESDTGTGNETDTGSGNETTADGGNETDAGSGNETDAGSGNESARVGSGDRIAAGGVDR
ncbi:cytochrome c oxidase subunit II [Halovivax limisalsi]|uniref:cytochrome c oxidase subunit II n=1 Tax=Halovivax limisalsi TaxID=1453760 RepID=UPI001FFC6612|nr:cytochrome c oxidase subunit II [Halovivax limisalsi]